MRTPSSTAVSDPAEPSVAIRIRCVVSACFMAGSFLEAAQSLAAVCPSWHPGAAGFPCGEAATILRLRPDALSGDVADASGMATSAVVDGSTYAVSDVVLRDGSTMRFHPPEPADSTALLDFFRGLSDRSLYLRFHGHPSVDESLVQPVLAPDWVERGALVGTKDELVVALASYVRLRDARAAEVAFAVADDFQGRGIAMRLLERLASLAESVGIEEFVAEVK